MYIRLHCLRVLWNLSTCFPNLKIILQSGPSVFKFNLKRTVIFLHKNFRVCNRSKQGELVPTHDFWIWFYKSDFKNTCRASPKPDVQHKNALISHLNDRWISKFLEEKFVLWKSSLIHLILHKSGSITSQKFECYYDMLYPELFTRTGPPKSGFLPQNRTWYVLKILIWLW